MKQLIATVVGSAVLALLPGCSNSEAAPVQNIPSRSQTSVSLAPQTDVVSENPIKIPGGPKAASSNYSKPITVAVRKQETKGSGDEFLQEESAEQDRKQNKQDKTERKNSMRQEGRSFDSKQDGKQRLDKSQTLKKPDEETGKQSTDTSKPAPPPVVAVSTESSQTPGTGTAASDAAVAPPASPSSSSGTAATYTVTFGSAASSSSRTYKKPTLPSGLPSWFTDNDKDSDGQLTMNEWPADRFEEFNKYDRNGDGIITIEEAMKTVPKAVVASTPAPSVAPSTTAPAATTAAAPPKVVAPASTAAPAVSGSGMSDDEAKRSAERVFSFVDTNKDGFLDEKEIANTQSIKSVDWKKYDANKDGKLDLNEAIALYKAEGANLRRGGMGGGGPGGPGGGGWGNMSPDERAKMMFDNMDKNKTGKISKEQFPGFWRDRFAEFDTNKDGFVDVEEFKTASAKMFPAGGRGGPGGGPGGGGQGGRGDNGGRGGRGGDNGGRGGRGGFGGGND